MLIIWTYICRLFFLLQHLFFFNLASNGAIQGDEDTWLQRLLDEAKSSDDEATEGKTGSEKRKEKSDDEEFNPFTCDFTRGLISRILTEKLVVFDYMRNKNKFHSSRRSVGSKTTNYFGLAEEEEN